MLLNAINSPADLKKIPFDKLPELAAEIRNFLLDNISKTGGHLASSLGVVELTIILHYLFDSPQDSIIWDVGHQAYAHKILTGRKDVFSTLRQLDGISGFPKKSESIHDLFDTGHSSTSVSLAAGIKTAENLLKKNNNVIAVIGDGSFTAGMVFEALNHIGHLNTRLIIILNNNEMSIARNIGAVSKFCNSRINIPFIAKQIETFDRTVAAVPALGPMLKEISNKFEHGIKSFLLPGLFFQEMGFSYLGPVNGYNFQEMRENLLLAKKRNRPVIVQINTVKGKGYSFAEQNPTRFHGIGAFDINTGHSLCEEKRTYTDVFSDLLYKAASNNSKLVAVTASMTDGTGLASFARSFPERFFDVGIAEQHQVTFSAGLSSKGFIPVIAVYATFLQRAYDQIIHDAALQKLPMIFCIDRSGISGQDGETHHGIFTLAFLRSVPDINIYSPFSENDFGQIFSLAETAGQPSFILYPRAEIGNYSGYPDENYADVRIFDRESGITIISAGYMFKQAIDSAKLLEKQGIRVNILNFLKIDKNAAESALHIFSKSSHLCIIEDNAPDGGFAGMLFEFFNDHNLKFQKILRSGIPKKFIEHGSRTELFDRYGLSAEKIFNQILNSTDKSNHE
ncbi:MAG: 1-deoxy-D-xylulose-5-phosphate synthase [Spirochaetes bacterium GWF1_41_5]|nr:MAG: 1-deoxy-D-xylulose-5-phosphate synthase [Spirochaetes bacterium GWF1_41_5]HBE03394.1 1-deoxy-D-xylulose-5-phosphate synthase [Spirochaetia bacterium]